MQFFCPTCQCWHEITDIAADMSQICQETMSKKLETIANKWKKEIKDEAIHERINAVQRFLPKANRLFFLFKPEEIRKHIIHSEPGADNSLQGLFVLTFNWVLDIYRQSGQEEIDTSIAEETNNEIAPVARFDDELRSAELFAMRMDFHFKTVGKQRFFEYIGPGHKYDKYPDEILFPVKCRIRACSYCGRLLPEALGNAPEIVIGLTGGPRAGKTSCVISIASSLCADERFYEGLGMSAFEGDAMWEELETEMEWYNWGYKVLKTDDKLNEVPSYSFLVRVGTDEKAEYRVLTFIDMPGEFWHSENGLTDSFFNKYGQLYENVDCIWMFISKLGVHNVDLTEKDAKGDEIKENKRLREDTAEDTDTVKCARAVNVESNLSELKKHMGDLPPMAIIITKPEEIISSASSAADVERMEKFKLYPVVDGKPKGSYEANRMEMQSIFVFDPVRGIYYLDERPFWARSNKVREYLKTEKPNLLQAIERAVDKKSYFSMAAYGHPAAARPNPKKNKDTENKKTIAAKPTAQERAAAKAFAPTPYRELFPLVWTLAISGNLRVKHEVSYIQRTFLKRVIGGGGNQEDRTIRYVPFVWNAQPDVKKSRDKEDEILIHKDLKANLLMYKRDKFSRTKLEHERRE